MSSTIKTFITSPVKFILTYYFKFYYFIRNKNKDNILLPIRNINISFKNIKQEKMLICFTFFIIMVFFSNLSFLLKIVFMIVKILRYIMISKIK